MKLPSKTTPYSESVLSKLPVILSILEKSDLSVLALYQQAKAHFTEVGEYIDTLDCLFILGKIALDEKGGKIRYVV